MNRHDAISMGAVQKHESSGDSSIRQDSAFYCGSPIYRAIAEPTSPDKSGSHET